MSSENNNIFKLLAAGKWEKALPSLKEYLTKDVSDAEKGKIFVMIAEAYMQASTDINERESAALKQMTEILQDLDETQNKFGDEAGIANARNIINS